MKTVLRTKKPDSNSYKYILDENGITIKRFSDKKEALNFLKLYGNDYKFRDWECITFKQFEEDLKKYGTVV